MAARSPNILWIMTDQHRADCLGCMGHPLVQTPHLDALAAEGTVFENAFCQTPVCMASRGSVMTGRYPRATGIRGMGILPPTEMTIAEILKCQGYRTGAFGKLHLTPQQYTRDQLRCDEPVLDLSRFSPAILPAVAKDPVKENYGFDEHVGCDDLLKGRFRRWIKETAPKLYDIPAQRFGDNAPNDLFVSPFPSSHHPTTFIANACADFLRSPQTEPWFAFCSFVAPHHPFEAPSDQIARYPLGDVPLPEKKGGVADDCIPEPVRQAIDEMDSYPKEIQRRIVQHYLASISLVDDQVGMLMALLRDTGQLDNTLVLFVADHGEFLGNHGLLRKPSLHYDEVIQVPLLMRMPDGTAAGRRVDGLVELVDVVPTILGSAGLKQHEGLQGIDWSVAMDNGQTIGRDSVYSEMFTLAPMLCAEPSGPYGACLTIRTSAWKLNVYPDAGPAYGQLFDLENDPQESNNLYGHADYREQREKLLWALLQRQHQDADPLPLRLTQY